MNGPAEPRGLRPAVTIVVPTYDRAATLGRAVASVLAQTVADLEVVVVDDGSTDGTAAVLAGIHDTRLVVHRQERSGVSAARNAGVARARAPLVAFLDSDDEARPSWLAALVPAFADPSCVLASCGELRQKPGRPGEVVLPRDQGPAFGHRVGHFRAGTFCMRRSAFDAVGGYASELRYGETIELVLRLAAAADERGWTFAAVPDPLVVWHVATDRRLDPAAVHHSAVYVLERHKRLLARSLQLVADHRAMAGVNAVRLGRASEAVRHFAWAVVARPFDPRHLGRLAVGCVPPLARLTWCRGALYSAGERIRVLQVCWRLSRDGGIPVVIRHVVEGLDPTAFDTHVLTLRPDLPEDDLAAMAGRVAFHHVGFEGTPSARQRVHAMAQVARVVRRVRPQILHVHSGTATYSLAGAVAGRVRGRVLEVHDAPSHERHRRATESFEGWMARRARFVALAHSPSVRDEVADTWRLDADSVELFPLGIDTGRFAEARSQRAAWREAHGLPAEALVVLSVTRLVSSKNLPLLLDVAEHTLRSGRKAVFVVVAGGTDRAALEAAVAAKSLNETVRLIGPRFGPDLVAAYGAADVFVSTSDYEGFGLAVVEAMAAGLPVVATAVGGVTDLLEDAATGFLVPPGQPEPLAAALGRLLDDDALRSQLGGASQIRARTRFDVATMVDAYAALYRRLA